MSSLRLDHPTHKNRSFSVILLLKVVAIVAEQFSQKFRTTANVEVLKQQFYKKLSETIIFNVILLPRNEYRRLVLPEMRKAQKEVYMQKARRSKEKFGVTA